MARGQISGIQQPPYEAESSRLTAAGLAVGAYLALFLCQFDRCMLQQERIRFAPVYPLLGSLAALGVILWYLVPAHIVRLMRGTSGAITAFFLIALFALTGAALPEANFAEGGKFIFYPVIDFLLFVAAIPISVLFASRRNWQATCGMALLAIVGSILTDARYPGTFSFLSARAAGFGINPNSGAAISVMLLIGVLDWKRPRLSLVHCAWMGLTLVGVFMTMSRSGTLVLGIVGMLYVRRCVQRNGMGTLVLVAGIAFSIGGYALVAADAVKQILPLFEANGARSNLFSGDLEAMDAREDSRVLLAIEHFEMGLERPILGWGTGLSCSMDEDGSHNMFLARWVENGLPGLLAYLGLIAAVFRIGWRHQAWDCMTLAIYTIALSFFSHNMLDDKWLLLMLAITAGRTILNAPSSNVVQSAVLRNRAIPYSTPVRVARVG